MSTSVKTQNGCAAIVLFVYPRAGEAVTALRGPLDGRPATVRGTRGFETTAQNSPLRVPYRLIHG